MRRLIVAAAFAAVVSTSAIAQSYTGQIHTDDYGRYETVVVRSGDNIWKLCKQFQWCRFNYANTTNAAAVSFLAGVAALNGRANMDLIHPGEVIKFPLPYGTVQELDRQDNLRAALNAKAQILASQVTQKDGVIADLRKQITELTLQVKSLLGMNTDLAKVVAERDTQIGSQKKQIGGLNENLTIYKWLALLLTALLLVGLIVGFLVSRTRREENGSQYDPQLDPQLVPQTAHAFRAPRG